MKMERLTNGQLVPSPWAKMESPGHIVVKIPKLLLVGPSRCGKDEAGLFLEKHTILKFAGTTSKYLCKYVARELGVSEEQAYAERHANRMIWYETGNRIRNDDPGLLVKDALQHGHITGGIRDKAEASWVQHHREYVDLVIWIENPRVDVDPTLKFDRRCADIMILNDGTLEEYHYRLLCFAKTYGILNNDR